ncbi:hypothetical protein ABH920_006684 [Catenulispora sp. EB89]|uniref:hypothetical protein n=1 Tax=Catenulispora sp. EB89 TaxID=3156257 RepID=UPI003516760C
MTRRPNSARQAAARDRGRYTGETIAAAYAGIPSGQRAKGPDSDRLGLDRCSPAQLDLRARMALGVFNLDSLSRFENGLSWSANAITAYTLTVSPRFDELVLITRTPDNVAGRLVRGEAPGLPGLRVVADDWNGVRMRDIVTGSDVVVTSDQAGRVTETARTSDTVFFSPDQRWSAGPQTPRPREAERLATVPPMSHDTKRLLAGLLTRLNINDPAGTWSTGNWFWDPFRPHGEPHVPRYKGHDHDSRGLWGSGDRWELAWSGYPTGASLIKALTHPIIGINGVAALETRDSWQLTLGTAMLELHTLDLDARSQ